MSDTNDTNDCRKETIELIEEAYKKGELSDSDIETIKEKVENVEIRSLNNKNFDISFNNDNWQKCYYDPQTEKAFTRRPNKSAVTRIIISNYDSKKIKELKVLYRKQGGVDTINVNDMKKFEEASGKICFLKVEKDSDAVNPIEVHTTNDGVIEFEKKDKYTKEITRKFKIWGEFVKIKGYTLVKVYLEDELEKCNTEKRRITAYTERKLIPPEQIKSYAFLLDKDESDIDSLTIYKTKRFMTYRSNMEFYYNFIDKFFMYDVNVYNKPKIDNGKIKQLKFKDLYQFNDLEDNCKECLHRSDCKKKWNPEDNCRKLCIDNFAEKIKNNVIDIIKNENNRKKKSDNNEEEEDKKSEYLTYTKDEIKEDIPKIVAVLTEIRHGLMHFNYNLFEKLFTGTNDSLTKNLDLNMFKKLSKVKKLKEESRNTYLEKDDEIHLMKKNINAQDIHDFYYKICNRKNGFNKFINSFFITDGKENAKLKDVINQDFMENIEGINTYLNGLSEEEKSKCNKLKKRLKELEFARDTIKEAYVLDIQSCPEYKKLYDKHKRLVEYQEFLISRPKNDRLRETITENNDEILEAKRDMENITKINAKIRLEYKMHLFFGFLYEEFDGVNGINFKDFMNYFNPSKKDLDPNEKAENEKDIKDFMPKGEEYLLISGENSKLNEFKLKSAIKTGEKFIKPEDLFENSKENNLFKLYILFYLLLPIELRGDFLGYAKEHYYGIKNVDYIVDEVDDKMKFFHRLRLFEKNIKKFEIISYSLADDGEFKPRIEEITELIEKENACFNGSYHDKDKKVFIFTQNIVAPILKFYEKIYDLYNMIEIHTLTGIGIRENKTLEEVMEAAKSNGNYNFRKLIENWRNYVNFKEDKKEFDNKLTAFVWPRNKIAHLNYENLFNESLVSFKDIPNEEQQNKKKRKKYEPSSIGEIVSNSVKFIYEYKLDTCADFGMNIVNDFYMSLDNYIFNIKKHSYNNITSEKKEISKKNDDDYIKRFGLENSTSADILKVFEKMINFEISISNINRLDPIIKNIAVILPTEKDKTNKTNKTKQHKSGKKDTKTVYEIIKLDDWKQYEDNINGAVHIAGSRIKDIYKKRIGLVVKDYLIKAITKNEKRLVNLYIVDKNNLSDKKIKPYMLFISKEQDKYNVEPIFSDNNSLSKVKVEFKREPEIDKGKGQKTKEKVFDSIAILDGHEIKKFNFESSYIHRIDYIKR